MQRPVHRSVRRSSGLTVLELLVSLSVISLLLALLVPAVMQARERARATACLNNLRQIISACHAFESSNRRFPADAGPYDRRTRVARGNLSGHVELLPFLDQQPLYQQIDLREPGHSGVNSDPPSSQSNQLALRSSVPVFLCPSDNAPAAGTNYRACAGSSPGRHGTPLPTDVASPARQGVFGHIPMKAARVRDGLSQTVFYSERVAGDRERGRYTPWRDTFLIRRPHLSLPDEAAAACRQPIPVNVAHLSFGGTTWLYATRWQTQYNHVLTPNSSTPDCAQGTFYGNLFARGGHGAATARSFHAGGVNAAFGDGRTKLIADSIDLHVWRGLASYAGNEIVSSF